MTDNNHPITPPPELVYRLQDLGNLDAIELAYQAGADQELEACCEWIGSEGLAGYTSRELRAARRPESTSLKEQGLKALDSFEGFTGSLEEVDIIRRALESIPD